MPITDWSFTELLHVLLSSLAWIHPDTACHRAELGQFRNFIFGKVMMKFSCQVTQWKHIRIKSEVKMSKCRRMWNKWGGGTIIYCRVSQKAMMELCFQISQAQYLQPPIMRNTTSPALNIQALATPRWTCAPIHSPRAHKGNSLLKMTRAEQNLH